MNAHLPPRPSDDDLDDVRDGDLDTLRAWAEGALPAPRARALEARMAADAHLAQDAALVRATHAAFAPWRGPVPPSRLAFEDLALPRSAAGAWRGARIAVAAAALLTLGLLWLGRGGDDPPAGPRRVALEVLRLAGPEPTWPAPLTAGWTPVREGAIAWLDDAQAAAGLARFAGRRVLVYVHHQDCPLCRALERGAFADAAVLARLEQVVPLKLDAMRLPEAEVQGLMQRGWPYLAVQDADGGLLADLSGLRPARELARGLTDALAGGPMPPGWDEARSRAAALAAELTARRALLAARERAAAEPALARRALEEARRSLAGTPGGDDLSRVLAAWPDGSPFPLLLEPSR